MRPALLCRSLGLLPGWTCLPGSGKPSLNLVAPGVHQDLGLELRLLFDLELRRLLGLALRLFLCISIDLNQLDS